MPSKTFADCFVFLMENWLRTFGPMGFFVIDQESAFAGNEMASVCDKFGIVRVVTGSDPANTRIQSKHMSTGLAEKHIDMQKLTMLKLHADLIMQGIDPDKKMIAREACMAQNLLLTFNGVTPTVGVLGRTPKDFWETDNASVDHFLWQPTALMLRRPPLECDRARNPVC